MNGDELTVEEFLDGFALWQEHQPQSLEDWIGVARRCLADPTFDRTKSSPQFRSLIDVVEIYDREASDV